MRGRDPRQRRGGPLAAGIRGIAGAIGFVSESISAYKGTKLEKAEAAKYPQEEEASRNTNTAPNKPISTPDDNPPPYAEIAEEVPYHDVDPDVKTATHDQSCDKVGEVEDSLEEEWALDDAQEQISEEFDDKDTLVVKEKPEASFLRRYPPPDTGSMSSLPLPVVLPQRRPKERSRGFIRAYAPILENCGIGQSTWLEFLDLFQKSSAANPWINTVNLAALAGMAVPSGWGVLLSYAVRQITNAVIEVQSRERTNKFLQTMNDRFFRPRGLFCLVMTWDPQSNRQVDQINIIDKVASRSHDYTGIAGLQDRLRSSDGVIRHDIEIPEVAPLIFPALDKLAAQPGNEVAKKGRMAEGIDFVAKYKDKRATARYVGENPNSTLAHVPQEQFRSRYADPNNPASSGSLITFVSGGKLVPNPGSRGLISGLASVAGQAIRGEPQGSGWSKPGTQHYGMQGYGMQEDRYSRRYRGPGKNRHRNEGRVGLISTPIGTMKKILRQRVLYLMVVQMPSENEMAHAAATIGTA